MRGRNPKQESRETGIRERLAEWRRTPEFSRPSLRALARELGTSHQLLGHYLKFWDRWLSEEYGRKAEAIRARIVAENRASTAWEEQQIHAYTRAQVGALAASALRGEIERIKRETKCGPLTSWHIKMLTLLARAGLPEAQELLLKASQSSIQNQEKNLPRVMRGAAKSFKREKA